MTERPSVPRLFISYASSDRDQVLPIVAELKGTGAEVWIDIAGIAGGESYASAIVDAIRDCDAVLLLCSAASLSSRNVHQEVALAWRFGRIILPLRLELVEIPDTLVYWLETAQWIDVLDRPPADWLPAILRALERIRTQSSPDLGERTHGEASTANVDLPAPATALLGRAGEVADLGHRLRSGARLLTLTGPGGVGKTRLALDVARSVEGAFPDGVKFVDLASVTDPTLVLTAIAAALGVREAAEQGVAEDLRQFLLGRRLLLVLDNVEQVIEAAGEIAGLLTVGPGIALLVTSRIPLNVRAEQDVPVGTLSLPPVGASVEAVRASPAVSLFVERARATGAEFEVTEANAAVIAEIVRRLDGLPLAIELAAARVRIFPPDALLPRLEHPLPLLTGGARDLPERQQTLTRTIEWSYDLLAQSEQALFRRLAVFVGGASFEAVEEVAVVDGAVDPYQGLAELVRHNLIRQERSEGEPRFSMLETIREYAADQLTASGEADILRERHAMYFLQLSGGARPPRRGSDQFGPWIATVEAEHDNLRTALTWAVDRPDVEVALQIASNIAQLWFTRGHFSEGRRWFEQIFAIGTEGLPTLRSQAYSAASLLARVQGDHRTSLAHAELAVTLARQSDDRAVLVRALYTLGGAYQAMARTAQAAVFLEEALALARGVEGLEAQVGSILNVLGDVTLAQGDHARAFELVEEGLALKRAVGDEFGSAVCLNMLGTIAFNQKGYVRAVAYFEESLAIDKKIGDREGAATAMLNLGGVAREQGDMVRAIDLTREALEAFLDLGDRAGNAFALGSFAAIAERRGEPALAVLWLGASAAIREAIGEPIALEQREEYDEFRSRLSRELGPEAFASQWARGQTQPEDIVIAEVLEWARVGGMPPGSETDE